MYAKLRLEESILSYVCYSYWYLSVACVRVCMCACTHEAQIRREIWEAYSLSLSYRPLLISNFPFCVSSQEMSSLLACFSPLCKLSWSLIEFQYFKPKKKKGKKKKERKKVWSCFSEIINKCMRACMQPNNGDNNESKDGRKFQAGSVHSNRSKLLRVGVLRPPVRSSW